MGLFAKAAVLAGAAGIARRYAKKNPEKVNKLADQVSDVINRRTNGKYSSQVDAAVRGVRKTTGRRPSDGDAAGHASGAGA
ncbi:antitoxin [Solihabitans fulvus]|uniref:Antitoxin n=1 Tax=Solihabitans fulvus TaxID=1892852 RepID=A0A5B2XCL9_9PSEU|nr:antitoxin [Solihabitans fulvus]KAA2261377.1 antitoxin [Solihabitans fulvus]